MYFNRLKVFYDLGNVIILVFKNWFIVVVERIRKNNMVEMFLF